MGIRMYRYIASSTVLLLTGCVFSHEDYVSEIVLAGKNCRGTIREEGAFYVDDDPLVHMRMGSFRKTFLGETMFPLIPLPIIEQAEPHESIAHHQFSLTVSRGQDVKTELSALEITVEDSGKSHQMRLDRKEQPENAYRVEYGYVADLQCGDIDDGILRIRLTVDKGRDYKIRFREGVKREINYQPDFVT